jgi:hypothetical protein
VPEIFSIDPPEKFVPIAAGFQHNACINPFARLLLAAAGAKNLGILEISFPGGSIPGGVLQLAR